MTRNTLLVLAFALVLSVAFGANAQPQAQGEPAPQKPPAGKPAAGPATAPGAAAAVKPGTTPAPRPPSDYVIGPADVLTVLFWREKDLSAEVVVRPDGKITLPLLNDVEAAGLTPDQLRDRVNELAKRYIEDPNATVVVRQINSRIVFITGQVGKPGAYALSGRMTVLQLIALAGGLTEFANQKDIVVMRAESGGVVRPAGQPVTFSFNYKDVIQRRNLKQNIELKPGDTVIVP